MIEIVQPTRDRLIRELANRYANQGYAVQIAPTDAELPEFLRGFCPDMILTNPHEKIVVEVQARGASRPESYWKELKNAIAQQQDWKLQLALNNRREEELQGIIQPILTKEQIEAQLQASQSLAESGLLGGALVLVWSALEAILRKASRDQGLELANEGPGPLVTTLYADGDLTRTDYLALSASLRARNLAVHGFQGEEINQSLVDQLQKIARRLTKKYINKPERVKRKS